MLLISSFHLRIIHFDLIAAGSTFDRAEFYVIRCHIEPRKHTTLYGKRRTIYSIDLDRLRQREEKIELNKLEGIHLDTLIIGMKRNATI